MTKDDIIEKIIQRHKDENDKPIQIHDALYLEPMLNYSGKMAKNAYWGYKGNDAWNGKKPYCGILDFRIIDTTGKMEHSQLIDRTVEHLPIEAVRHVYLGHDPSSYGLEESKLRMLCDIQCTFLEQEINWGENNFQHRTYFGDSHQEEHNLRNAFPRDFLMLFFEKITALIRGGITKEKAYEVFIKPNYKESFSANKNVIFPPLKGSGNKKRIIEDFKDEIEKIRDLKSELWITNHLTGINNLCQLKGESPFYKK